MVSKIVDIYEIKAAFIKYAKEVMRGRSFIIANRNKPFAILKPVDDQNDRKIVFGVLKGKFKLPDDFNSELVDFENECYK